MDVLNTYSGNVDVALVIFAVVSGLIALLGIALAYIEGETGLFILGVVAFVAVAVLLFVADRPIRHEVTLRPGHVIDATKYEIVEQRGQIYVIEERKEARK